MTALAPTSIVGVIGAGAMGAGIAEVAATAGHTVLLFDAAPGAAAEAQRRIGHTLDQRVAKGRLTASAAAAVGARIKPAPDFDALAPSSLVVEAIVENLEVKRRVFADVERLVGPEAILATNTSSLSVTAIATALARPGRFAGMHFFNPATLMKLVEVISGAATDTDVINRVAVTAEAWGKVAVRARSTPGFIVNRVARPYYAEAWRLVEEGVADCATIDALLVEAGGFRLGPFALMDLIGHDVNYAVTCSIFEAHYYDPRYRPSLQQKELVDGGRLGRKSGQGVYTYGPADAAAAVPKPDTPFPVERHVIDFPGVTVTPTTGRLAVELALSSGTPTVVLDWARAGARRIGFAASPDVPAGRLAELRRMLSTQGVEAVQLADSPGLVVFRTVAMLVDEAYEAALHQVATPADIDLAMRFGVNYPQGPFSWGEEIGLARVLAGLDAIHAATGDPRYRGSFALRRKVHEQRCQTR